MSKIKAIDFAKSVKTNKARLVQHCLSNGVAVSDSDNLDTIVNANNTINKEQSGFKVTYKNLDGTILKIEYVESGGTSTPPANPTFDSDYLEFDYWAVSGGDSLNNITRETLVMPQYKTKLDETLNERPTYLICYFGGLVSDLSPTLKMGQSIPSNTYIDWGDGSAAEQITSTTISHTYASEGLYVIKIYGTWYMVGGRSGSGIFNTTTYTKSLLKAYIGENQKNANGTRTFADYAFDNSHSLQYAVLEAKNFGTNGLFSYCKSLTRFVIGSSLGITSVPSAMFKGCFSLTDVIIPSGITFLNNQSFGATYGLKKIVLPNSITYWDTNVFGAGISAGSGIETIDISTSISTLTDAFYGCVGLKEVVIPNNISTLSGTAFRQCLNLAKVTIQNANMACGSSQTFAQDYGLHVVNLPDDFDGTGLNLSYAPLTKECLIDFVSKLKDNSETSAKSITLHNGCAGILAATYVDQYYNEVPYGTAGANSLLTIVSNKNWTLAFFNNAS